MIREEHRSPRWQGWLTEHRLTEFEAWWRLPLDRVGRLNRDLDHDGWSSVSAFETDGRRFFVKRQSDYLCRRYAGRRFAVPRARIEHRKIGWYERSGVPSVDAVYFGWRTLGGQQQAVLVTEALAGFVSLRDLARSASRPTAPQRRALARSLGRAIARLHESGMRHNNLYPKHVLVRRAEDEWEIRLIDLENTRRHFGRAGAKLADLESLSRRARGWSRTDRLRVLLAYLGRPRADAAVRAAALRIRAGTRRKRWRK